MANNRRQEILDAYAAVIAEKGLAKASFSAIAGQLGIPQSLIFHYFKNKEDLTQQLAASVFHQCEQSYFCRDFSGLGPPAAFAAFMDHVFHIHEFRKASVDSSLYYTFINQAVLDPVIRQSLQDVSLSTTGRFEAILRQAAEQGLIRPADPAFSAWQLLCLVDGLNCSWVSNAPAVHAAFASQIMVQFLRDIGFTGGTGTPEPH